MDESSQVDIEQFRKISIHGTAISATLKYDV